MNYFKIVSTNERNRGTLFSAVPHQWEKNNNLFWPDNLKFRQLELVRSNAASKPEADWGKYPCNLKCTDISTFKEALILERQFSECADSEAEQMILKPKNKKDVCKIQEATIDRNNLFCNNSALSSTSTQIILNYADKKSEDQFSENAEDQDTLVNEEFLVTNNNYVENMDYGDNTVKENNEVVLLSNYSIQLLQTEMQQIRAECSEIKNEMQQIKAEFSEIKNENVKITIQLDKIYKLLVSKQHVHSDQNISLHLPKENKFKEFVFPLNCKESIAEFEKELQSSPEFVAHLISEFSKIYGKNGDQDGIKVGYKLVDHIFSSQVLTEFTWTGVSRSKSEQEKKPFNCYDAILSLIYNIIVLADNRYTIKKNECLFRDGILKHSKKRNMRKRLHKRNSIISPVTIIESIADQNNINTNSEERDINDAMTTQIK